MMDWSDKCRYKILVHRIIHGGKVLDVQEILYERKKTTKAEVAAGQTDTSLTPEQVTERKKEEEKMSMKPFYPDDWEGSFGVPVKQHENVTLRDGDLYQSIEEFSDEEEVT